MFVYMLSHICIAFSYLRDHYSTMMHINKIASNEEIKKPFIQMCVYWIISLKE